MKINVCAWKICSFKREGMNYGVDEMVRGNTLGWFDHSAEMGDEMATRIYNSGLNAVVLGGKVLIKIKNSVRTLVGEGGYESGRYGECKWNVWIEASGDSVMATSLKEF